MFKFFARRKQTRLKREHRRGFDFACGRIIDDGAEIAIPILIGHVECVRHFGNHGPFDEGVEAAIKRWEGLTKDIDAVVSEMRNRLINNGKNTSPTLIAWADRIDAAFKGIGDVQD